MDSVKSKIYCQEWNIDGWGFSPDGSPGWQMVERFVRDMDAGNQEAEGWFLLWNPRLQMYALKEYKGSAREISLVIKEYLYDAALVFVRMKQEVPMEPLLSQYVKGEEGMLQLDFDFAPFPGPLEMGEWFGINDDQKVLVINHDGDPVYLLNKA